MSRDYQRLPIVQFGIHLLSSGDLDPIYIALHKARFTNDQRYRFLVAYWCLYHAGVACWLAEHEGAAFWEQLTVAANNDPDHAPTPLGGRWPRGSERRHWRGKQALASAAELEQRYQRPEDMIHYLLDEPVAKGKYEFKTIQRRVREHRGFGPWIAFKVGDMLDRCFTGIDVSFEQAEVFMFKDPAKAAMLYWMQQTKNEDEALTWYLN